MKVLFTIPGSDIMIGAEEGHWVAVDSDGKAFDFNEEPKKSVNRWLSSSRWAFIAALPESWLDENNWRKACWQVPKTLRVGYYRKGEERRWIGHLNAPTNSSQPIFGKYLHPDAGWLSCSWSTSFFFDGWEYVGETLEDVK